MSVAISDEWPSFEFVQMNDVGCGYSINNTTTVDQQLRYNPKYYNQYCSGGPITVGIIAISYIDPVFTDLYYLFFKGKPTR